MESRSSAVRSFEVAWRSKASKASSRFMPWPSSETRANQLFAHCVALDLDANAHGSGVERVLKRAP